MSLHKNPKYQIPELIESLKQHGLKHDTPSQLSDTFRIGYVAALDSSQDAERLDFMDADAGKRVYHVLNTWYTRPDYDRPYQKHANLREAIDVARAAQKDGVKA